MDTVVIRGGGDLATGIAHRLFNSGYNIVILEIEKPLAIRREVSFSEAVYRGEITIEGIRGVLANDMASLKKILDDGSIPICVDEKGDLIRLIKPIAVVDAIIAKKNLGTNRKMAAITIGVGPGFEAGVDVDLVVESNRGHHLGKVIHQGKTAENTGIPGTTMGYTEERIIRAAGEGLVLPFFNIGDSVEVGDIVCKVGDIEVVAMISGILRGMIPEGIFVAKGLKIGDIDPRGDREFAFTISDKARAIGGGVLEGIQYSINRKGICNGVKLTHMKDGLK